MGKKKHHEEEHENHERWLVSYADFITLLFAFFVVMYAVSRVDNNRLAQAAEAIRFAMHFEGTGGVKELPIFQGPPSSGGNAVVLANGNKNVPMEQRMAESMRRRLEKRLHTFLRPDRQTVAVLQEGKRLVIRLSAGSFFDPADALLRPAALPILDAIGAELSTVHQPIRVEGHTDDRPVRTARFRDNWELSASRAATVVAYLEQAHRIPPRELAAVGLAASHPLVKADTPEARESNRRVDLVIELDPADTLNFAAR